MVNDNVTTVTAQRDSWQSKWGFILACIGSAVGMGNIWLFPSRVAKYGGAFLLAYFIFDILIGFSGVIGEMSFGRAARSGPVGAFEKACASRGKGSLGAKIGLLPMAGALALSLGIAIQNFPEGAIISMPLKGEGMSKPKAFVMGVLSGVVEPIGGAITVLLAAQVVPLLPYLLSFAAGAMLYVVIEELIPESQMGEHSNVGTIGAAFGFLVMMILDVALG